MADIPNKQGRHNLEDFARPDLSMRLILSINWRGSVLYPQGKLRYQSSVCKGEISVLPGPLLYLTSLFVQGSDREEGGS